MNSKLQIIYFIKALKFLTFNYEIIQDEYKNTLRFRKCATIMVKDLYS